ncbi:MAG: hypothetical protein ACRD9R_01190 [Pyrinomonadaceae bacterium]
MAEERNLATARAAETTAAADDDTATKADLQRRMDQARESITHTVEEIKDTVSHQYNQVRETISQSLDWREQYRRRPLAFTLGALGVGMVVGYGVGGALRGSNGDLAERYYRSEGEDYGEVLSANSFPDLGGAPASRETREPRTYAGQPITGGTYAPTSGGASEPSSPYAAASRPSYSSGYQAQTSEPSEPEKPGVLARFKETQAYDRLQQELSTLGSRAVDELSKTAQNVVLPALLGRVKDMIGIDLSTQREVAQRSRLEQQTGSALSEADASAQKRTPSPATSASTGGGSMGGSSSAHAGS